MNDIDEVECIQHELLAVIGKYHRLLIVFLCFRDFERLNFDQFVFQTELMYSKFRKQIYV